MIRTRLVRELDLEPQSAGGAIHLSAASGLVAAGRFFHVVADDENHLGVFDATGNALGALRQIFRGDLPQEKSARKKRKADLEILLRVPAFAAAPHGALLALGSGSRPTRERGAWFALDAGGGLQGEATPLDLAPLYAMLRDSLPELNLEGAVIVADQFILLQRASRRDPRNALLRMPLHDLMRAISTSIFAAPTQPPRIETIGLGQAGDVPWTFTDASATDDGHILFTAVTEDTPDSYSDGKCLGSAIGCLAPDGRLVCLEPLDTAQKVEGLSARRLGDAYVLHLVTDADDANVPAQLLEASFTIPR